MWQQLWPQIPPVIKTVAKAGWSSIRGVGVADAGSAASTTTVLLKIRWYSWHSLWIYSPELQLKCKFAFLMPQGHNAPCCPGPHLSELFTAMKTEKAPKPSADLPEPWPKDQHVIKLCHHAPNPVWKCSLRVLRNTWDLLFWHSSSNVWASSYCLKNKTWHLGTN